MPKRYFSVYLIVLIVAGAIFSCLPAYCLPEWFPFNTQNALKEWQEKVFKNRVVYEVEPIKEGGYLSAKSDQACSSLLYRLKFNPRHNPMISWKWKITKFPHKTPEGEAEGGWLEKDDYAARVYVIFPSLIFMNIKCIEYIWDEHLPEGTIITSPYYKNIKLIVAQSGSDMMNQWVAEEQDIYEDYKRAFNRAPGAVGAIALMTDTDNTLSTAEAQYTDLKVGYKR